MKSIGEIISVLSADHVLIKVNTPLNLNQVVIIAAAVKSEDISKQTGLEAVLLPKGELKIDLDQGNNIYLASRFRESKTKKRTIINNPWAGLLANTLGKSEEITEIEYGEWSVKFDKNKSLNIKFSEEATVGDKIVLG